MNSNNPSSTATALDKMMWATRWFSRMKPVSATSTTPPKTRPPHNNVGMRGWASNTR
jgi:hypothetical protein